MMRALGFLLVFSWLGASQPQPVSPILRGVLLECDSRAAGELAVRAADNQVFRYSFDEKTYVEREERLIQAAMLKPGERVEVVSDRAPGLVLRYARTIHVIAAVTATPAPVHT